MALRRSFCLNITRYCKVPSRKKSSALYILSGDEKTPFAIQPFLDFDTITSQPERYINDLQCRGKAEAVSVFKGILPYIDELKTTLAEKDRVRAKRKAFSHENQELFKNGEGENEELRELGRHLREEENLVHNKLAQLEKDVIVPFLSLPNTLHKVAPRSQKDELLPLSTDGYKPFTHAPFEASIIKENLAQP